MNRTIIIIETIILTAAFTAMILIPLIKNPVWWHGRGLSPKEISLHSILLGYAHRPYPLPCRGRTLLMVIVLKLSSILPLSR